MTLQKRYAYFALINGFYRKDVDVDKLLAFIEEEVELGKQKKT